MRSTRHPWVRTGLMGLVPLLLPFVWLLELDSCGHQVPLATELTGVMVVGKLELQGWMLVVPVLLLVLLPPYFASRIPRLGWRVLLHAVALLAALVAAWGAFMVMFFTLFTEREPRGVGWVVVAAFAGSVLDASLRVGWSTQEWVRARRAEKLSPGTSP